MAKHRGSAHGKSTKYDTPNSSFRTYEAKVNLKFEKSWSCIIVSYSHLPCMSTSSWHGCKGAPHAFFRLQNMQVAERRYPRDHQQGEPWSFSLAPGKALETPWKFNDFSPTTGVFFSVQGLPHMTLMRCSFCRKRAESLSNQYHVELPTTRWNDPKRFCCASWYTQIHRQTKLPWD